MSNKIRKPKARIKQNGEVFTPPSLVKEIIKSMKPSSFHFSKIIIPNVPIYHHKRKGATVFLFMYFYLHLKWSAKQH